MTKLKFLLALHNRLSHLPQDEVEERLNFYAEMIEDRMEEGLSEEDAVSAVGSIEEIAAQIQQELCGVASVSEKPKAKRQMKTWEIVLLVLGSPVWLSLAIAAVAVGISVYAVAWSLVVSLWAVFVALAASGAAVIVMGVVYLCQGNTAGVALVGAGMICTGLSMFLCLGCKALTRDCAAATKNSVLWILHRLIGKEDA